MNMDSERFEADLSHVRHELRTPLNAIIGYSEMLLEEAKEKGQEDFMPDLERIREAGRRLLSMVGRLLQPSQFGVAGAEEDAAEDAESDPSAHPAARPEGRDLGGIRLPEELYGRLRAAAEIHNVTRVRGCLAEVDALGEEGARLAAHLHALSRQYDMEGILTVLGEIRHG